ncbi:MAG: PID-CTERM protein-sorting domain-containing protein [Bacteroidota bacterium]
MKKKLISTFLAIFLAFFMSTTVLAQDSRSAPPPPPDDPSSPTSGSSNGPVGKGAPIGGGMGILLALGAAYGGKKFYDYKKRNVENS